MNQRSLNRLLQETGTVTHHQGRTTVNASRMALSPAGGMAVASHILLMATEHSLTHIGSPADGGIPIMSQAVILSAAAKGPHPLLKGFYHRTEVKDHGVRTLTEGHAPTPGDRAALVTDLTTTGHALLKAAEAVALTGAHLAFAFTTLEKGDDARRAIERTGLPFFSLHRIP